MPDQAERRAMGAMLVQSALDQYADSMPPKLSAMAESHIAPHGDIDPLFGAVERTVSCKMILDFVAQHPVALRRSD